MLKTETTNSVEYAHEGILDPTSRNGNGVMQSAELVLSDQNSLKVDMQGAV